MPHPLRALGSDVILQGHPPTHIHTPHSLGDYGVALSFRWFLCSGTSSGVGGLLVGSWLKIKLSVNYRLSRSRRGKVFCGGVSVTSRRRSCQRWSHKEKEETVTGGVGQEHSRRRNQSQEPDRARGLCESSGEDQERRELCKSSSVELDEMSHAGDRECMETT